MGVDIVTNGEGSDIDSSRFAEIKHNLRPFQILRPKKKTKRKDKTKVVSEERTLRFAAVALNSHPFCTHHSPSCTSMLQYCCS